jgi:hypothetical protein
VNNLTSNSGNYVSSLANGFAPRFVMTSGVLMSRAASRFNAPTTKCQSELKSCLIRAVDQRRVLGDLAVDVRPREDTVLELNYSDYHLVSVHLVLIGGRISTRKTSMEYWRQPNERPRIGLTPPRMQEGGLVRVYSGI